MGDNAIRHAPSVDGTDEAGETDKLAYELWVARGCPVGSPDVDWFEAERQLKGTGEVAASSRLRKES
jgi:Protein of unknown function (DUF2934)